VVVVIVVATMLMMMVVIMIVVVIIVMVAVTPVIFVVMFVRVPISPTGGIIAVVVTVPLIVTAICQSRTRGERHRSEANEGSSGEGNYCPAKHEGFLQMCAKRRSFS
jgi:ABC-type multidrug transport system fused ATPase/permease subunit